MQWDMGKYYVFPLPVTLGVNHESRKETLQHYLVYFQGFCFSLGNRRREYTSLLICLPHKSDSTFFFASSVLVFGREQLPL
jgi:hypothetical protein